MGNDVTDPKGCFDELAFIKAELDTVLLKMDAIKKAQPELGRFMSIAITETESVQNWLQRATQKIALTVPAPEGN